MWTGAKAAMVDAAIAKKEADVACKRAESAASEENLRAKLASTVEDLKEPVLKRLWKTFDEIEDRLDEIKGRR